MAVPIMFMYTAELAVHGWDLSTAVGRNFAIADEFLGGALFAAKMIPDVDRGTEAMPFSRVVDPGPDASLLLQTAGWMRRQGRLIVEANKVVAECQRDSHPSKENLLER
jgi:hypothetical protein